MKARYVILAATSALIFFTTPAYPHEVSNMEHTHAFQQTGYGKYRQGHYVNGAQGSIIIWSPRTYTRLPARPGGRRLRALHRSSKPRRALSPRPSSQSRPTIEYGKQ